MSCHRLLALVAVALCCSCAVAKISWIGTYRWAAVTPLNANIMFNCALMDNGTEVVPENHTILPGTEKWKMPHSDKFIFGPNLTINNIGLTDKGIYLCHADLNCTDEGRVNGSCLHTGQWYKHGLNLNGPMYANLMEKYQTNFIMGAASGGGVLALFALLCLVYKFRHKEPMKEEPVEFYPKHVEAAVAETSQAEPEEATTEVDTGTTLTKYSGATPIQS